MDSSDTQQPSCSRPHCMPVSSESSLPLMVRLGRYSCPLEDVKDPNKLMSFLRKMDRGRRRCGTEGEERVEGQQDGLGNNPSFLEILMGEPLPLLSFVAPNELINRLHSYPLYEDEGDEPEWMKSCIVRSSSPICVDLEDDDEVMEVVEVSSPVKESSPPSPEPEIIDLTIESVESVKEMEKSQDLEAEPFGIQFDSGHTIISMEDDTSTIKLELAEEMEETCCRICGQIFNSMAELGNHVTETHKIGVRKRVTNNSGGGILTPNVCIHCKKGFVWKREFLAHRSLVATLVCPFCPTEYKCVGSWKQHVLGLHLPKPNGRSLCEFCSTTLSSRYNLLCHYATHIKDQKYVCPFCPENKAKSFKTVKGMDSHLKSFHSDEVIDSFILDKALHQNPDACL